MNQKKHRSPMLPHGGRLADAQQERGIAKGVMGSVKSELRDFAVVDCETTGLHPTARIVQFAVVYLNAEMLVEDQYVSYVHGDGSVGSAETVAVHGISESDVANAPTFGDILPIFESEIRRRTVFAHFAPFDKEKIDYELSLLGKEPLSPVGCTKALGDFLGYGVLRLSEATRLFGIDPGRAHDAASDALSAASVLRAYRNRHPVDFEMYLESLMSS